MKGNFTHSTRHLEVLYRPKVPIFLRHDLLPHSLSPHAFRTTLEAVYEGPPISRTNWLMIREERLHFGCGHERLKVSFYILVLQFKCVQNINAFLMSCHRDFGVSQADLFQAADLYDVSDFAQVGFNRKKAGRGGERNLSVHPLRKMKDVSFCWLWLTVAASDRL